MIIAVDFDGTIHGGSYPSIGYLFPDVRKTISSLRANGHYVIIWTCRTGQDLLEAINWLLENKIEFDRINDNHPSNIANYGGNTRKIFADLYIDDKQVGELPKWDKIEEYIINNTLNTNKL
ncbi:MAG: hypothetical protein BGO30_07120 [Bacteroidetes bacterium 41-46]|nr:MAG: hypothetical protein BGO30_07120 [Bacteroidetes bacterium 41-46]